MYQQIFDLHADLLKALAHPRRLEIIHLLREQKLPVSDIHAMLDLPQANISQHLMILRDAGIVTTRRDGRSIYYSLSHPKIIEACDALREMLIERYQDTKLADSLTKKMSDFVPLVHDPVCLMRISPRTAGFRYHFKDKEYFFCASGCLKKFKESPDKYV